MKKILLIASLSLLIAGPLFADSPEKKIQQAIQKEEEGNYEAAQTLYEEVLKESPHSEKALFGLAGVFYWEGDYQKSLATYLKLLEKNPNHVDAMLGISKVYLAMGNQRKAQEYLGKAEKIEPENKEVKQLRPQIAKKTRIWIYGGTSIYNQNYANGSTQAEFQTIEISKEKAYGFGLKNIYLRKFDRSGFDTKLFGHIYFFGNTKIDAGLSFAPSVNILPKQSYTAGLSQTVWKVTPEIHYTFQDYSQANLQFLRPGIFVEPFSFLRVGGGYEFHRLSAGTTTRNFKGGFADVKIFPLEWLTLHGFYEHIQRGFEGGRAPTPFVNYTADVGGGGVALDFLASYAIHFDITTERRSNNDKIDIYTLAFGFTF